MTKEPRPLAFNLSDLPALLTLRETKGVLRLSTHTVMGLIEQGKLPGAKLMGRRKGRWRVPRESVLGLIRELGTLPAHSDRPGRKLNTIGVPVWVNLAMPYQLPPCTAGYVWTVIKRERRSEGDFLCYVMAKEAPDA